MPSQSIRVDTNMARAIAQMARFSEDVRTKAVTRTLNDVIGQVRTRASRAIRATGYNLKAREIKKRLRTIKASSGKPHAAVMATGKVIPLIQYDARQEPTGVSVKVLHGRKTIRGAFIATMSSGHIGVFIKVKGGRHRKVIRNGRAVWEQLPIKELFGPAIPDAFGSRPVLEALDNVVGEKFEKIMSRNLAFYASRS